MPTGSVRLGRLVSPAANAAPPSTVARGAEHPGRTVAVTSVCNFVLSTARAKANQRVANYASSTRTEQRQAVQFRRRGERGRVVAIPVAIAGPTVAIAPAVTVAVAAWSSRNRAGTQDPKAQHYRDRGRVLPQSVHEKTLQPDGKAAACVAQPRTVEFQL